MILNWALRTLVLVTTALWATSSTRAEEAPPHQRERSEVGEGDYALRRARAMHDMYADKSQKLALHSAEHAFVRAAPLGARPARGQPLPLSYPDRDPNARLNVLLTEAATLRTQGSTVLMMLPAQTASTPTYGVRNVGPINVAGRVSALAIDPSNESTIYRGAAGGGVWVSRDGGSSWLSLTDQFGDLSIGAVAVAPSEPNIVYVGTGEGTIGIDGIDGIGFISSLDGGKTWQLPNTAAAPRYFAISVNPIDPRDVIAGTTLGVQKSIDAGAKWDAAPLPGYYATELHRVPGNPARLIATLWDYGENRSGSGFIYASDNDGASWAPIGGAGTAPFDANVGRLSIAISPTNPQRIYALGAAANGDAKNCPNSQVDQVGLYRSDNGGASWSFVSDHVTGSCPTQQGQAGYESILGAQGWYANTLLVDRQDPNVLYAGGLDLWVSRDAGVTWTKLSRWSACPDDPLYVHADIHALVQTSRGLFIGNDGGVNVSTEKVNSFASLNKGITTRQFYSVAMAPGSSSILIGGAQDNATNIRVADTSLYREVIGGDGFAVGVNPTVPGVLYGTLYYNAIYRSSDGGDNFADISPNITQCQNDKQHFPVCEYQPFITPLAMDSVSPTTLYTAATTLWRTTNEGKSWARTSTTDLTNGTSADYVATIGISRSNPKHIITGSAYGIVKESKNGGASWSPITQLPAGIYVSHVEFDPSADSTYYVSYTGSASGKRLYRTTNGGKTFEPIEAGLKEFPVHVVRAHPCYPTTLFAGTDVGLFVSTDEGTNWSALGSGMPSVSVWDIAISSDGATLGIASHGRGFFEISLPAGLKCR